MSATSSQATLNRSFPSSKNSYFQNEAKCKTFLEKMSFICRKMKKKKSVSYQWLRTQPRFETVAWGNSEIAYG